MHAGAAFTLECSTLIGAELHVFGFNWNDAHADTHTIADEEMLFRAAEADGTLVIHPTGVCHMVPQPFPHLLHAAEAVCAMRIQPVNGWHCWQPVCLQHAMACGAACRPHTTRTVT